jgi:hypothetical protein
MSKWTDQNPITGSSIAEERLKRVEQQVFNLEQRLLNSTYLLGRLRTDRVTAPVSSTDVNDTDKIYDVIRIYPYEYVLINNSGTYNWVRLSMSTF